MIAGALLRHDEETRIREAGNERMQPRRTLIDDGPDGLLRYKVNQALVPMARLARSVATSILPRPLSISGLRKSYAAVADFMVLVKSAGRFSRKAVSPSLASSERTCSLNSPC